MWILGKNENQQNPIVEFANPVKQKSQRGTKRQSLFCELGRIKAL